MMTNKEIQIRVNYNNNIIQSVHKKQLQNNKYFIMKKIHIGIRQRPPNTAEYECPICIDHLYASNHIIQTECGHNYCKDCLVKYIMKTEIKNSICAICRTTISNIYLC